jgi:hypothetical protein
MRRAAPVRVSELAVSPRLYCRSVPLVALVGIVRDAKRRNPKWSLRSAVRRRGGNLALPLEVLHSALGKRRVHQLERFFGLLD